jgi:hypothetical protein
MGVKRHPDNGQALVIAERRTKVADLRLKGWTFEQIGDSLGVTAATAYRDYKALIAQQTKRHPIQAERLKREITNELTALKDQLFALAITRDESGNVIGADDKVIGRYVQIVDKLSALHGLQPQAVSNGTVNNTYVLNWGNGTPAQSPALPDGNTVDSAPIEITWDRSAQGDSD